eukprot:gnl/TRDRNA2_/TRDRNA2_200634_c0_seq1.p1 gnl/TRDRNA2_/TRDRNA2_200634_c0~~gnl/TRDRNA2_/TRDRNA2_200634_c0_seq1.p1  ORF type:complete len:284 (+),score=39.70 gnl/TRDRNA2_/TRDRNA2_200634_c0_seq1:135-986(+)
MGSVPKVTQMYEFARTALANLYRTPASARKELGALRESTSSLDKVTALVLVLQFTMGIVDAVMFGLYIDSLILAAMVAAGACALAHSNSERVKYMILWGCLGFAHGVVGISTVFSFDVLHDSQNMKLPPTLGGHLKSHLNVLCRVIAPMSMIAAVPVAYISYLDNAMEEVRQDEEEPCVSMNRPGGLGTFAIQFLEAAGRRVTTGPFTGQPYKLSAGETQPLQQKATVRPRSAWGASTYDSDCIADFSADGLSSLEPAQPFDSGEFCSPLLIPVGSEQPMRPF